MWLAVGHEVARLSRTRYGPVELPRRPAGRPVAGAADRADGRSASRKSPDSLLSGRPYIKVSEAAQRVLRPSKTRAKVH